MAIKLAVINTSFTNGKLKISWASGDDALAADGGNIVFRSYNEENKVVSVILQGACSGCPSSTATLTNGIENLLKEMLPNQINEVVAING